MKRAQVSFVISSSCYLERHSGRERGWDIIRKLILQLESPNVQTFRPSALSSTDATHRHHHHHHQEAQDYLQ